MKTCNDSGALTLYEKHTRSWYMIRIDECDMTRLPPIPTLDRMLLPHLQHMYSTSETAVLDISIIYETIAYTPM